MKLVRLLIPLVGLVLAWSTPVATQTTVSGRNVTFVQVPTGKFIFIGSRRWQEKGDDGQTFDFVETERNDWTVVLSDATRGVHLQVDLRSRQIFYWDTTSPRRPLYRIVSAAAAAPPGQVAAPKAPAAPAPAPKGDAGFASEVVGAHNEVRSRHGAPPLRWSDALARTAMTWAVALKAKGCAGGHSGQAGVGENIGWAGSTGAQAGSGAGRDAVRRWYWCEIGKYDARNPGFSSATGHYTQVVWAGTAEVGCALVSCSPNEQKLWQGQAFFVQVVVCQYGPPGNVQGSFPQNVKHISPGSRPAGVSCN